MKRIIGYVTTLLFIFTLVGCRASFPSPEIMKKKIAGFKLPSLPENGMSVIYVVRPELLGALVKFNVYLDDKEESSEMGYTQGKEYIYFHVKPGKHNIKSLAENWAEIELVVKENEIVFLEQESKMGFLYARNNLYNDYTQLEGKYRVRTLSLGTIKKTKK